MLIMGICLDTESKETEALFNHRTARRGSNMNGGIGVPVIFVLGGPGSGKISHSQRLSQESQGRFVHVNVMELLKQSFGLSDSSEAWKVPAKDTLQVLKNVLLNSPGYKDLSGYIISAYPRHTADLVLYSEELERIDGVILINWHEDAIKKQIEYGARERQIKLDVAKAELRHYKRHVIPVAEFFDFKQQLYVVGGERPPEEVFADFVAAFDRILHSNNRAPSTKRPRSTGSYRHYKAQQEQTDDVEDLEEEPQIDVLQPPVIWICGGPGSNKATKIQQLLSSFPGWRLISVGDLLWTLLEERGDEEVARVVGRLMRRGDLVPPELVVDLVIKAVSAAKSSAEGFFVTGFPREEAQVRGFEERMNCRPTAVLIDCSELELGRHLGQGKRGRPDDHMEAYKRRLHVYRHNTMPMFKLLDEQNRLRIVDGDMEEVEVLEELRRCLQREIQGDLGVATQQGFYVSVPAEAANEEEQEDNRKEPTSGAVEVVNKAVDEALLKIDD